MRSRHPVQWCRAGHRPRRCEARELAIGSFSHPARKARAQALPFPVSLPAFKSALRSRSWKAIPPRRNVPFCGTVLALSGGTSHRGAAARPGRVRVLLERNPPNRPLAPVGTPASGRESNPAPHKTKGTKIPSKTAQPAPQTKNAGSAKLPVKTIRLGRIKAAVWENESDSKKFYNVTFARTYVDEAKNYHDTDSFGRDDLPLVAKLADQAHTFIFERLAEARSEQGE